MNFRRNESGQRYPTHAASDDSFQVPKFLNAKITRTMADLNFAVPNLKSVRDPSQMSHQSSSSVREALFLDVWRRDFCIYEATLENMRHV